VTPAMGARNRLFLSLWEPILMIGFLYPGRRERAAILTKNSQRREEGMR
jgi:hypothetical protein